MEDVLRSEAAAGTPRPPSVRLAWVDWCRLTAAASIFLFHFVFDYARLFGQPLAEAATAGASRVVVRADMWGISFFVVLMGVSEGLARRQGASYRDQVRSRLVRILLPLWILAVPYVLIGLLLHEMQLIEVWKVPFWLLGLNVLHPSIFWPVSQAWWYVTLAVQWALVAPFVAHLIRAVRPVGAACLLGASQIVVLVGIGLLPDRWGYLTRGFIGARGAEIGLGLVLAVLLAAETNRRDRVALAAAALALVGVAWLSHPALGANTTPVWLLSYVALSFGFALATRRGPSGNALFAAALVTYPFYLVHAPIQKYAQTVAARFGISSFPALLGIAFGMSAVAAVILHRGTDVIRWNTTRRKAIPLTLEGESAQT